MRNQLQELLWMIFTMRWNQLLQIIKSLLPSSGLSKLSAMKGLVEASSRIKMTLSLSLMFLRTLRALFWWTRVKGRHARLKWRNWKETSLRSWSTIRSKNWLLLKAKPSRKSEYVDNVVVNMLITNHHQKHSLESVKETVPRGYKNLLSLSL